MSLISIAIVKYSAQNCLNAVVNTELFAYSFIKLSRKIQGVPKKTKTIEITIVKV
jgi:hypothetical protein